MHRNSYSTIVIFSRVERNLIDNPDSRYEIGSRLIEPNTELDCRNNWLGHKDEKKVWAKVFDRDDRLGNHSPLLKLHLI